MKTFRELQEGVYDPNIFKAFFLAGGPGSGKSYVVERTTQMFGMRVVNSDDVFEKLIKKAGMNMDMRNYSGKDLERRDEIRGRAKEITKLRQQNYIEGRIGLIIDGTGKDYVKIEKQMRGLQQLGYESHMIFVNTSLDVALARNEKRDRKLPESIVVQSWNNVQKNIGKFSQLFKNKFIIIDNNKKDEDVLNGVYKRVRSLANKKVTNGIAKAWITRELEMKRRT
jgi:dephospho-CoA kinase